MQRATDDERASFERAAAGLLLGRTIEQVAYWHLDGDDGPWDHGTWHDAEMGVDLVTDAGRASVNWTSRFYPYGVEVLPTPVGEFLQGDSAGWDASAHPFWRERAGQPVERMEFHWATWTFTPPEERDVPVALRLDFRAGPVWMVAAVRHPGAQPFVGGDGILVVLDAEEMARLGFTSAADVERARSRSWHG